MTEHYFSAAPTSALELEELEVDLRGTTVKVLGAPGVFSHNRLDLGTKVLLRTCLDPAKAGYLVDLGCGWGPIALSMALASPQATVLALDVNERARQLTALNAEKLGLTNIKVLDPDSALELLDTEKADIAELWSNPPVRVGKEILHDISLTWFSRLAPGAVAKIVMGKNLGADSYAKWLEAQGFTAEKIASAKGFRILKISH